MEGSCRLGAVTTAVVEGAEAADIPLGTGSSLSKRDTACKQHIKYSCVQGIALCKALPYASLLQMLLLLMYHC